MFVDGVQRGGADTEAEAKAMLADILAREKRRAARPGEEDRKDVERTSAGSESDPDTGTRPTDGAGDGDSSRRTKDGADVTGETVGPEIAPVGGAESGDHAPSDGDQPDMVRRFLDRIEAAVGRAFDEPIGLDPEDVRILRESGLFRTGREGRFDPMATIRAFNEILIGGGAAGLDLTGRLGEALINATAAAIAQIAQELGETKTGSRMLERDLSLLLTLAAMLGTTRGPRRPSRLGGKQSGETEPAEAGKAASSERKRGRRDQPVAVLTGKEMTSKKGYPYLIRAALAEKDKLKGQVIDSLALSRVSLRGGKTTISGGGLGKAVDTARGPGAELKLRMFPAIPDILRKGWVDRSLPPRDRAAEPNTRMYHYVRAKVRLDGRDYLVEAVVREDNNGNLFYDFDLTTRREMQAGRFATAKGAGAAGAGATLSGDAPKADSPKADGTGTSDNINLTIVE